ncbi:MAG: cupin domain-containing protein [Betaproteobacteria bacterium]|nr:cupin domain-containing protein [Betaproteobacteria bacterium]
MKADLAELLQRLPGPSTPQWPDGERFVRAFAHGTMSVELYAPAGHDPQTPHAQDEIYIVQAGRGEFTVGEQRHAFGPGTALFVPAGVPHRFERFTPDFVTWVVFWGPPGGEGAATAA